MNNIITNAMCEKNYIGSMMKENKKNPNIWLLQKGSEISCSMLYSERWNQKFIEKINSIKEKVKKKKRKVRRKKNKGKKGYKKYKDKFLNLFK